MTETPRELAETIVEGKEAWTDRDAVTVSAAYLELRAAVEDYLLWTPRQAGHAAAHQKLGEWVDMPPRAPVSYRVSDRDVDTIREPSAALISEAHDKASPGPADVGGGSRQRPPVTYSVSDRDAQQNADQADIQARLK